MTRTLVGRMIDVVTGRPAPAEPGWIEAETVVQGSAARVIDVRSPEEFTGPLGHVPGAVNLPIDRLEAGIGTAAPDRAGALVLVCHTDKRSAAAAAVLRRAGYGEVAVLRGGMVRWNQLGLEVSRS